MTGRQPVRVREAEGRRGLSAFVDLPYRLHAGDPLWAPPFRRDVKAMLSPGKNPFFDHAEAAYFLAERGGETAGRIAAISNRLHNETHGDKVGFFGFFDCADDPEAAEALLAAAGEWVKARGHDVLRGPASFSLNDECGVLVEGFETPPTLMMPHNPRYVPSLLERAGFTKAKDLWVYQGGRVEERTEVPERLARGVELVKRRLGIRLRPLDMKNFDAEVAKLRHIYNAAWEKNWGHVPMTEREFSHLAKQFKPVALPDLVPIAEIDGEIIGFGLALPDLNQVLLSNRSGRLLPAALKLMWALKRRKLRRLRIVALGLLPEYRGRGIDAVLYHWIWTRGGDLGYYWGEAGWILEDNPAMNQALEKMTFRRYKTYRLYDRPL